MGSEINQGNIIDYFSFINPNLLNKDDTKFVTTNDIYINSPLNKDIYTNISDLQTQSEFEKNNDENLEDKIEFIPQGSEKDYLQQYNFLMIDNINGAGFQDKKNK
jgi:hypothetical protein